MKVQVGKDQSYNNRYSFLNIDFPTKSTFTSILPSNKNEKDKQQELRELRQLGKVNLKIFPRS